MVRLLRVQVFIVPLPSNDGFNPTMVRLLHRPCQSGRGNY